MSNLFKDLLESGAIDVKVQEALEQKLEDVKSETRSVIEEEIRAEYSSRFEKDKNDLIKAMDTFLHESVSSELSEFQADRKEVKKQKARLEQAIRESRSDYDNKIKSHAKMLEQFMVQQLHKELSEFASDRKAVAEQRVKLSSKILEARKHYDAKLAEHKDLLTKFMTKQLHEEIKEFYEDKKVLEEQKRETAKQLQEQRVAIQEQAAERINKLENFVTSQLKSELLEFKQDKDALIEERVKLAAESKKQIAEAKAIFVKRASKLVESTIASHLKSEMTQFKDDIKEARQNNFGRKIFEAFSTEFMSSYLSEGTKVKQVTNKLDEANQVIAETNKKLEEMAKEKELAERKIHLIEAKSQRTKVMSDLLSPLKGQKKELMRNLLENVNTDSLKTSYQKFLPHVMENGTNASRKPLTEGRKVKSSPKVKNDENRKINVMEATGNRYNRLAESVEREQTELTNTDFDTDIVNLARKISN